MDQLLGVSAAAQITGLLPQTLRARAESGRIPIARRNPLRFRLSAIMRYRESAPALGIGRPRDIVVLFNDVTNKYARAAIQSASSRAEAAPGTNLARRRFGSSRKRVPSCR